MKHIAILFFVFLFLPIEAQIKSKKIDVDNIMYVLKEKGYQIHSYDLSALLNKDYEISVYVESSDSTVNRSFTVNMGRNRRSVNSLSPEEKVKYLKTKPKDKKFYSKAQQLSIYILPYNDSIMTLVIDIPDVKKYSCRINLSGQNNGRHTVYLYNCVSIKPGKLMLNERDPLLFFGSYWWDADVNLFRFCGLPDLETGVTSCDLSIVPHFYTIGIQIKEIKSN